MKRGFVHVQADRTKSARRRLVKMAPNLIAWLQPFADQTGPVYDGGKRSYHLAISDLVDVINGKGLDTPARTVTKPVKWPLNGLRHSFASYFLAKHHDAAKLALEMGHTTTRLIFESYRELVTPEAAELYWSILPAEIPANVVQMATAQ